MLPSPIKTGDSGVFSDVPATLFPYALRCLAFRVNASRDVTRAGWRWCIARFSSPPRRHVSGCRRAVKSGTKGCPANTSKMKHPARRPASCSARRHVTPLWRFSGGKQIRRKSVTRKPCKSGVFGIRRYSRRYRSQFGMFVHRAISPSSVARRSPRINAETFSHTCPRMPTARKN